MGEARRSFYEQPDILRLVPRRGNITTHLRWICGLGFEFWGELYLSTEGMVWATIPLTFNALSEAQKPYTPQLYESQLRSMEVWYAQEEGFCQQHFVCHYGV